MADNSISSETLEILQEMGRILNIGLDNDTLTMCVRLCEMGAHPEALAMAIRELKKESAAIRGAEGGTGVTDTSGFNSRTA